MSNFDEYDDDHTIFESVIVPLQLKVPKRYRVILLNDDFTPMDFVVEVLQQFFSMDKERATSVMLQVHQRGQATCGVYSRDVAEAKVTQVRDYVLYHQHPLGCNMEAE